jgi:hypothetical protein
MNLHFAEISMIDVHVLLSQIERHLRDIGVATSAYSLFPLKQKREIEHSVGIVWCSLQHGAQTIAINRGNHLRRLPRLAGHSIRRSGINRWKDKIFQALCRGELFAIFAA